MEYMNIPLVFNKEEIPQIQEIIEAKEELYQYVRTNEEIDIKYQIKECVKGYYCIGQLYYGNEIVREYNSIDEIFMDLNSLELNILLKQMNDRSIEER